MRDILFTFSLLWPCESFSISELFWPVHSLDRQCFFSGLKFCLSLCKASAVVPRCFYLAIPLTYWTIGHGFPLEQPSYTVHRIVVFCKYSVAHLPSFHSPLGAMAHILGTTALQYRSQFRPIDAPAPCGPVITNLVILSLHCPSHSGYPPGHLHSVECAAGSTCGRPQMLAPQFGQFAWPDSTEKRRWMREEKVTKNQANAVEQTPPHILSSPCYK